MKQNNSWETFPLPFISGGVISQIIADPIDVDHLYGLQEQTVEWQTIIESKDSGDHWYTLANLQHIWIHYLEIDPVDTNVLYIGSETGIYRSDNGGINWTKVANFGPLIAVPAAETLYSIEKLKGTPECPTGQSNFVRSYDRGNNWEKVPLKCGIYGDISSSRSNHRIIYLREIDPKPNGIQMLVQSIDGGDTWSFLPLTGSLFTMGLFPVVIDPNNPEKLYSSSGTGIIVSTDGGQTWNSKLEISITGSFLFSFTDNVIYAGLVSMFMGAPGVVYRSSDEGDSWKQLPVQLPSNLLALLASSDSSDLIYIGLDGYGVERSIDGGQTWRNKNVGLLSTTEISRLMISPDQSHQLFAIVDWPRPAMFKSDNGGLSWGSPLSETKLDDVTSDPGNANLVWAVGPGGWVESQDGGNVWKSVSSLSGTNLAISPDAPDRPCATHTDQAEGFLVCRSLAQNGKETWQSYLVPGSKALSRVVISPSGGSLIFAGGTPDYIMGTLYQSEDGGKTWRECFRGPPNYVLIDLAISWGNPAKVIAVFEQYQLDNLLVYESLDTGKTWRDITSEMSAGAGGLSTQFTYRASVFIDALGVIYFASGDLVLIQPTTRQPWEIFEVIDDRIYAAGIENGVPGFLWLVGEKNGWKTPLLLRSLTWIPVLWR